MNIIKKFNTVIADTDMCAGKILLVGIYLGQQRGLPIRQANSKKLRTGAGSAKKVGRIKNVNRGIPI